MDPILLQKQLRENTNDLQDFCKELREWSSEMKRKQELSKDDKAENAENSSQPSPKVSKSVGSGDGPAKTKKSAKSKTTDYAAWEKFDVEKECQKVDTGKGSDSESELTDEFDETLKDEAVYEKERGNKFVKNQKWDDAIKCYTKAIACYGYDPVFYANRALCFLKIEKWKEAESDCTTALQLDKTYVKAYQRRAAAREKLNQLSEARADLKRVLEYEPKNKESMSALEKVEKLLSKDVTAQSQSPTEKHTRPVSKFTQSRQAKKVATVPTSVTAQKTEEKREVGFSDQAAVVIERKEPTIKIEETHQTTAKSEQLQVEETETEEIPDQKTWPEDDTITIIQPIKKTQHTRSKVPLKRITIKEIERKLLSKVKTKPTQIKEIEEPETELKVAADKQGRKKSVSFADIKENQKDKPAVELKQTVTSAPCISDVVPPTTSVQFFSQWRQLGTNLKLKYTYLKVINPADLKEIFKESLDSRTFSDIVNVLIEHSESNFAYKFLLGLSNVNRFTTLAMFMSKPEIEGIKTLVKRLEESGCYSEAEMSNLKKLYYL